ncbi:hypothetical protein DTO212C5_3678 [Paecilomyces variotii]|nr:hypothetical protein DTO212C5_3678 [Paecilomyces variotii]KAJ9307334.1 hypothetical protein DTO217A2_3213 [Paecilomyces variotii]
MVIGLACFFCVGNSLASHAVSYQAAPVPGPFASYDIHYSFCRWILTYQECESPEIASACLRYGDVHGNNNISPRFLPQYLDCRAKGGFGDDTCHFDDFTKSLRRRYELSELRGSPLADGRDGIEFLRAFGLRARPLSSTYSVGWQGWWNPKVIWKHSKCVGPLGTGQYYGLLLLPF